MPGRWKDIGFFMLQRSKRGRVYLGLSFQRTEQGKRADTRFNFISTVAYDLKSFSIFL